MRAGLLLVALGCLGAARAQFPSLPASCTGTVSSFTALLGAQAEIDAACPKGATSCSEACKAALAKVQRAGGRAAAEGRRVVGMPPATFLRLQSALPSSVPLPCPAVRFQDGGTRGVPA